MDHAVIGILGSSGGLGASTLTVALAQRAGRIAGATVCVDAQLRGGGLDVTACVEHVPGLRWSDLSDVRGEVDGPGLLARLPAETTARVLSCDDGPLPDVAVVSAVVTALRQACALTVVDLPREGRLLSRLLRLCDAVLVVSGLSARHVADATAVVRLLADDETAQAVAGGDDSESGVAGHALAAGGWPSVPIRSPWPSVRLVVRGPRRAEVLAEEVAAHLRMPLWSAWADDARVALDAERGRAPGTREGSRLVALCDQLIAEAVPGWSIGSDRHALVALGGAR